MQHLTPVTLELGGKSPLLLAPDANIAKVANRILFGKTANAGQTCVAPDYVLVARPQLPALVEALQQQFQQFYPADGSGSTPYTSVINQRHYQRLLDNLQQAQQLGATVIGCDGQDYLQATKSAAAVTAATGAGCAGTSHFMATGNFWPGVTHHAL